ncbi:phospholipase D-like protein [Kineococcus xinjiangensis]|uniref:Phospholipase D-like protein n=1 Tax=Kineococcus xinjiangensis TaxID=512762 RepID=A0A2S6IH68_9ACTN|nr:PLD nuclease N-terminal domain-containing protein [Kineococcus xinjiangensis]PPK93536.1 phospholipase D-like protein [Kineococcus xinjiangensis]
MLRALIVIAPFVLVVYCLVHCIQAPDDRVRHLPKWAWILLIIFAYIVGPLAYLIAGRPLPQRGAGPGRGGLKRAPRGPDDDPDFLRNLEQQRRKQAGDDTAPGAEGGKPPA